MALQGLADEFGLIITVTHYPPGASKWNPIDHRMFSLISANWAGEPLVSYETVLGYIRRTRSLRASTAGLSGYDRLPHGVQGDAGREGTGPAEAAPCVAQMELHDLASWQLREMLKLLFNARLGEKAADAAASSAASPATLTRPGFAARPRSPSGRLRHVAAGE